MSMTMTQKILAAHSGLDSVTPGQLIKANLDMVLGNDVSSPIAISEFERAGFPKVFDKEKITLVMDHFVPTKDIKAAQQCRISRDFAKKHNITNFFDAGKMGIEHALLPENGLIAAGELLIGADSHTCTYGALGAFSTGVGSTDLAAALATGQTWLKVPEAISFELSGKLKEHVSGKDVILYIIGQIGVDGARYMSMEFKGDGIASLSMDDRFTIANMAVEAGAKNAIFPVDSATREYMQGRVDRDYVVYEADEDAVYQSIIKIDLDKIEPIVAFPHLPENTKSISEVNQDIFIQQVVIGSCTNGRLTDLKIAAEILKGKVVHPDVRTIIIPATQAIYKEAIKLGYIDIFIDSGCAVSTPTCGSCFGGFMGILADNEKCVATINRNFIGRMGHETSEVYLASPAVAAASAIAGKIFDPRNIK